jgi:hypothetical protein
MPRGEAYRFVKPVENVQLLTAERRVSSLAFPVFLELGSARRL